MDWINFDIPDFRWYFVLPNVFALVVLPFLLCYFFCCFNGISFRWKYGTGYVLLSVCLSVLEVRMRLSGSFRLFLEILLLTFYGAVFIRRLWREAWATALLLRSVLGILDSILQWISYRIFFPLILEKEILLFPSDTLRELIRILLLTVFFTLILRYFYRSGVGPLREQFLVLTVPVFFIALVEQVIQDSFYGDTVAVDMAAKVAQPVVNVSHGDNLFLQVLAGGCLFVVLFQYQKLVRIQLTEKKLFCLERQAAEQRRYIEEAVLREKQTRAFRHDLQNHMTVLRELLRTEQKDRACEYLSQLYESAEGLSCTVRTGNAAADVLLGSKCAAAKQKGIKVRCELSIPEKSALRDIDWCILLSNAFDNAVNACEAVSPKKRYLKLSGKRKGNFYLLLLENSCSEELRIPPPEGTGLSNIRAVLEPVEGMVEKKVSEGVYRLKLFFVLSQRKNGSLHQPAHLEGDLADK